MCECPKIHCWQAKRRKTTTRHKRGWIVTIVTEWRIMGGETDFLCHYRHSDWLMLPLCAINILNLFCVFHKCIHWVAQQPYFHKSPIWSFNSCSVFFGKNGAWPSFQSLLKENWLTSIRQWLSLFPPSDHLRVHHLLILCCSILKLDIACKRTVGQQTTNISIFLLVYIIIFFLTDHCLIILTLLRVIFSVSVHY